MTRSFLLLVLIVIQLSCFWEAIPSESQMIAIFSEHQSELYELVQNLKRDMNIVQISEKDVFYYDPNLSPLSEERASFYREQMKRLQIKVGIHRDGETSFRFIVFASAPSVAGPRREMSFAYLETEPKAIVESVDRYVSVFKQPPVYQRLAEHWYIVYESW